MISLAAAAAAGLAVASAPASEQADDAELLKQAQSHFRPLPKDMATIEFPTTQARVRLGRALFFEPRISADGTVSCARCHQSALYGTDGLPKSVGLHGKVLARNAPTVLDAGLYFTQHWDGRFASVEEQAKTSLLGAGFGNPDFPTAMRRVKAIPGYEAMFRDAFPGEADPITEDNWGKAIGAYERTLVTPSRFDDYLGGRSDALTAAEQKGLKSFIDTGCVDCHKGPGVGGLGFRKFGVSSDYWKSTGSQAIDKGRSDITKDPADLYKFKVAGLRNVAMTPPYFHDGSVASLPEAVRIMAKVQLDTDLSRPEVDEIVVFLNALTGTLPEGFERAPVLPPAGFDTPSPAAGGGTAK
jgi:cytochrome c peroxidase